MVTGVDARCETVAGNMPGYENVAGKPCPVKPFFMGRARYESNVLSCVALHLACPVESYSTGVCNVALCEVVSQRGRRAAHGTKAKVLCSVVACSPRGVLLHWGLQRCFLGVVRDMTSLFDSHRLARLARGNLA